MDFVIKTIKVLFYMLDKVIYGWITDVYGLLLQIARTSVFEQNDFNQFSRRIYSLIGIFMLFKISVSLINYVLNPDDFVDKERGFTQIVKRVILSLVMVVLVPYVFTEAYELQSIILEENTIMNFVFGTSSEQLPVSGQTYVESAGSKMQYILMYNFVQPNYNEFLANPSYDLADCQSPYAQYTEVDEEVRNGKKSVGDYKFKKRDTGGESRYIYELNPSCFGIDEDGTGTYVSTDNTNGHLARLFENSDAPENSYQSYAHGVAEQNFSLLFRKDVILARETVNEEGDGKYVIDYRFGLSTAAGIAVLYMLLMFCIDIAVRSVKFGFLQLIAPIPILSYCDPKSSKDGMFKKWTDMCVKTYLDLFFRLGALYFGIYVISLVGAFRDVITGQTVNSPMVSVFMIIGILIFIKKLPDIIKEVFNVKSDGKFTLNPVKRLSEDAIGGKQLVGAGRKVVGLGAGLGTAGAVGLAGLATGRGLRLGAMGKAVAGGWRGDKFGKNFANSYRAATERNRQVQDMRAEGVGLGDQLRAQRDNMFGRRGAQTINDAVAATKAIQDDYKAYESAASKVDKVAGLFAKERDAAVQRGDFAEAERWGKAFDNRMSQLQGGEKIVTELAENTRAADLAHGNGEIDAEMLKEFGKKTADSDPVLTTLSERITTKVKDTNTRYANNVDGYQEITGKTLKEISNSAGAAQRGVEASPTNATRLAAAKYVGGGKGH